MFRFVLWGLIGLLTCTVAKPQETSAALGIFEGQNDVGNALHPGSAEYDRKTKAYTVSGSGENMWFASDEFHFVWKKVSSEDVTLTADISILGTGGNAHRKGVLMIRQSLDGDSAYVDAARHGEGLTSLQFRDQKGAITREVEANVSGPKRLRIEKQGDRFYMWIAAENEELQFAGGSAHIQIHAPFYVGIGVCAHQKDAVEKAAFTNVGLEMTVSHPRANYSTVETALLSGDARSGYVSEKHLSAPGWSADGRSLTFEVDGQRQQTLFTPLRTAAPVGAPVTTEPDKTYQYFASDSSGTMQIWRKTANGGDPEQLTSDNFNNVSPRLSPDGKYLLFLSYSKDLKELPKDQDVSLRLLTLADKSVKTISTFIGGSGSLGPQPWSPDSRRVTFISYQAMQSR
jgi:dipeptidyl aminopeptidase/acylaminoacyl peptidase